MVHVNGLCIPTKTYLNEEDEWKLELPSSESESSPTPDEAKAPPTNIVFKHFLSELDLIMNPPKANDSLDMWPLRLAFIGKDSNSYKQQVEFLAEEMNIEIICPDEIIKEAIQGNFDIFSTGTMIILAFESGETVTKMVSTIMETEDCNIETIVSNDGSPSQSRASIQSQTTPTPVETPMMDESNSRPNSQENLDEQNPSEATQSNADQTEYIIEDTSRAKLGGEVKEILASGSVLSSELISKLLKEKLTSIPLEKEWVIVGFPTSLGKILRFREIQIFGEIMFSGNLYFQRFVFFRHFPAKI